jgi:GH43 family beta-xylosidase
VPGQVIGPGHNSSVSSPVGQQDYVVYHAWNEELTARQMWVDPLLWTTDGPVVERFAARIRECNRTAAERGPGTD